MWEVEKQRRGVLAAQKRQEIFRQAQFVRGQQSVRCAIVLDQIVRKISDSGGVVWVEDIQ